MDKKREMMADMIIRGAIVLANTNGFTIKKHENDENVVYPMADLYPALFSNPNITGDELKLWIYLKSLENTQINGAFPSFETIMKHQSMARQKLTKVLTSLEEKNMLFRLKRKWADSGKQTSNLYFFNDYDKKTGIFYENGFEELKKKFPNKKALVLQYKDASNFQLVLLPDNE